MPLKCITCNQYSLKYKERLSLTPRRSYLFTPQPYMPPSIECPLCHETIGATELSRLICLLILFISIVASGFLVRLFPSDYLLILIPILVFVGFTLNILVIWPNIIRLKRWEAFEDALPKSRLVGYSAFVLLPFLLIIGAVWLLTL